MIFLALTILDSGVPLSMLCAVIGLVFAFFLIAVIVRSSPGNERMREISAAMRQYRVVGRFGSDSAGRSLRRYASQLP